VSRRPRATSLEGFYGWHVVGLTGIVLAATAPGQTAAVSVFIDPMIEDLGISRATIATSYLIGTLVGAAAMPAVGRALDRFGVRLTMACVGGAFGTMLIALASVSNVVGLTGGFVGIRMLGQGALGLIATTATALWFARRRGTAMGISSAAGAVGISLAPVALERLIASEGWRTAWVIEGLLVWAVVLPIAVLGLRDHPSDLGQQPDGRPRTGDEPHVTWGVTRAVAMRSPFFWVLTGALATSGLLATAVAFHQISLLGERGLSATEAAGNFLPQTAAGLGAAVVAGVLVDRYRPGLVTAAVMLLLAGGLTWGAVVTPGWSAIGFGIVIGAAGGSMRTVEGAAVPRYYGTLHIGAIRGFVMAVVVGSTALGPLCFALVRDATGTYTAALLGGALLPVIVAVLALIVRPPASPRSLTAPAHAAHTP
jgi:MFS family permease